MTLVEFLEARIAEDEAVARAASTGPWEYAEMNVFGRAGALAWSGEGCVPAPADGEHITRHDPSRVLAECEAKRALIGAAQAWRHETVGDCWYSCGMTFDTDVEDACCDDLHAGRCTCWVEYARRQVLQPLALPYADHPDYRQEWRP